MVEYPECIVCTCVSSLTWPPSRDVDSAVASWGRATEGGRQGSETGKVSIAGPRDDGVEKPIRAGKFWGLTPKARAGRRPVDGEGLRKLQRRTIRPTVSFPLEDRPPADDRYTYDAIPL
jgi:hypothetical protein